MDIDIETLQLLSNDLKNIDKFIDSYSMALNSAWDRKNFDEIWELQKVLFNQCEFMFNEYIKLMARVSKHSGEIQ